MLFHITKELVGKRKNILDLFNYVGELDSSISVAGLRLNHKTCDPISTEPQKMLAAKNMYHPLVKNCKPNNITLAEKSILITGSNMSGKSTFLRTITINAILAQTLYTCFADAFQTPVLKQFSSIKIEDDLLEGKSFYFEEVSIIGNLLKQSYNSEQNLFILDEVFKAPIPQSGSQQLKQYYLT